MVGFSVGEVWRSGRYDCCVVSPRLIPGTSPFTTPIHPPNVHTIIYTIDKYHYYICLTASDCCHHDRLASETVHPPQFRGVDAAARCSVMERSTTSLYPQLV